MVAGLPHSYQAGQFITIDPHQFEPLERWVAFLEDEKGRREPPRAYSLASAPHEPELAITIKEERYESGSTRSPPLLSPLLVRGIARGHRMSVTGFTGPYILPPRVDDRTDHLVHVVAGSGSVPNWSILKHALREHPHLLRELIPDPKAALVYACGPANGPLERAAAKEKGEPLEPRFLETAVAALDEIGVPKDRVKRESYG